MSDVAVAGTRQRSIARGAGRIAFRQGVRAEVLEGADAYDLLRPDWERLVELQPGATLFQTPTILKAWARHFDEGGGSLATVVLRREQRPMFIWPLRVERRGLIRVVVGAGTPIGQYDEILIDPDTDVKAALKEALRALSEAVRPDLVLLERVRADSALRAALHDTPPLCWSEAAPYADLSQGMGTVLANQKSRVARHQRKRMKRFQRTGDGTFGVARGAAEAEAWLVEALALKRHWLQSTGRVSRAFIRTETANCLVDFARTLSSAAASPRMIVSRVALDGRTAAVEAGFVHRGAYHLYLGAFAPEFAKLGPGNILTQLVIEWCADYGLRRYDMLAPRSRHKSEWQTGETGVVDFALPMSLGGRLYAELALKRLAPALRQVFYALPAGLRSKIAETALRMWVTDKAHD